MSTSGRIETNSLENLLDCFMRALIIFCFNYKGQFYPKFPGPALSLRCRAYSSRTCPFPFESLNQRQLDA